MEDLILGGMLAPATGPVEGAVAAAE
jgi:hypothetical protein